MKLGLGIDAGGTFTDAVIYDFECEGVLYSAKASTQKEDLKLGIRNVIDSLPEDTLNNIGLVSLSTTLATNACVEGKGGRPILILIGCDSNTVMKYGHEYGLPAVKDIIFLEGGHTYDGDEREEPHWNILKERVSANKDKADSFAVVELSGMMNPEYEIKAREMIEELTGLPVVYGSEVSRELNFMKRAASTIINAVHTSYC